MRPPASSPSPRRDSNLKVDGVATTFTGVNAYELATAWGTNNGCGDMVNPAQMASFFSSLTPGSLVRFWAFQGDLATDVSTHQLDWAPIDQVFYLAAIYHVYLIPVITDQGGTCDGGHWQDPSWYAGGYRTSSTRRPTPTAVGSHPSRTGPTCQELVNRYKNSPALGMWEPISEPEASTCPAADQPSDCSGHQTLSKRVGRRRRPHLLLHRRRGRDPLPRSRAPGRGGVPRG